MRLAPLFTLPSEGKKGKMEKKKKKKKKRKKDQPKLAGLAGKSIKLKIKLVTIFPLFSRPTFKVELWNLTGQPVYIAKRNLFLYRRNGKKLRKTEVALLYINTVYQYSWY